MTPQRETVSQPIIRKSQTEVKPTMPRRSRRVMREPDRYYIYDIFRDTYIMVIEKFDDDHVSDSKAIANSEANLWQKAMDAKNIIDVFKRHLDSHKST